MNMRKMLSFFGVLALFFGIVMSAESIMAVRFLKQQSSKGITIATPIQKKKEPVIEVVPEQTSLLDIPLPHSVVFPEKALIDVPFTPQAPFAEWGNLMFENACEEAAMVMAMHWINETPLSREEARSEIVAITAFEKDRLEGPYDLSAEDTARIMKEYFHYENISVHYGITIADIHNELAQGNVVLVPVNGQKLFNPFYTPPGAVEHTLVIIGYDTARSVFITNDPGTRRGEKLEYTAKILAGALQDYPTGNHVSITKANTAMVVIEKKGIPRN